MEIEQKKKQEKSPGQEQKEGQLQTSNFAARAERNGAQMRGDQGGNNTREATLADLNSLQSDLRAQTIAENRKTSVESKATSVPEAANKQKLKEQ